MDYSTSYINLVNSLHDSYFELDDSGTILLANSSLNDLAGTVKENSSIYELFPDDAAHLKKLIERVINGFGRQKATLDLKTKKTAGCTVTIEFNAMAGIDQTSCVIRGRLKPLDEDGPGNHDDLLSARQAIEKQTRELTILNHLATSISSSLDLDDILHSICQEMVHAFDARNTGIATLNKAKDRLKVVAFYSEDPEESDVCGLEFPLEGNDASLFVIKTGEPIVVPDAQSNPITRSLHEVMVKRGTTCLLLVPLMARGEVTGTIGIPSNSGEVFSHDDVRLAQTIAGQLASVISNAHLHQKVLTARDVAEKELEIGRRIQTGFFPDELPQIPGWHVCAAFQSARQVAGDFFDTFTIAGGKKQAVILADVCDKGVGAALFMVLFRSMIRSNLLNGFRAQKNYSPQEVEEGLLSAIAQTNEYIAVNHAKDNMFATVFCAVIDQDSDELCYMNCGHDAPAIIRKGMLSERLLKTGPAIGMFADITLKTATLKLGLGDALFAFTDGVTDAQDIQGKSFGEERTLSVFSANTPINQRIDILLASLASHTEDEKQYDDITCIGIERSGTAD